MTPASQDGPPSTRVDHLIRSWIPLAVLLALVARSVQVATATLTNSDTFFHLRWGAEFLDGWRPWDAGQPSTASTADWVPTQWLPEVGMSLVERAGGLPAVSVLYGVLLLGTLAIWFLVARHSADLLTAAALTAATWVAAGPSLSLRPQVLSLLFITVTVVVWSRTRTTGRVPWALVPTTWVWACCHGMWILGVAASVLLAIGVAVERANCRRTLLVPAGMLVAATLTPAGPRLVAAVFEVNSRAQYFGEWGPPDLVSVDGLAALALFAVCVASFLGTQRASPFEVALLAVGLTFLVYSERTVPVAAAALLPLAAERLQLLSGAPTSPGRSERLVLAAGLTLGLVAVAVLAPIRADRPPPVVTAFSGDLDRLPEGSRVLTDSDTGGYLLWSNPELDIPVHGYGDVYTDHELEVFQGLFLLAPGWDDDLTSLHVDAALLPDGEPLRAALEDRGWRPTSHRVGRTLLLPPGDQAEAAVTHLSSAD